MKNFQQNANIVKVNIFELNDDMKLKIISTWYLFMMKGVQFIILKNRKY